MAGSSTMTIRVSTELKKKLERLSDNTRRSKSFLAGEAVAAYVEQELAIIDGIKRGIADVEAGRIVTHDDAMAEIYAAIEEAKAGRT
ncbi:CopG family ribbon-helix-helix protein [Rhizobium sp. PL01]|uniref:CopG family ribbon-helix-helix protein n=1 Tax=Rhizobium sp. PL01 TaxID=3085631 RepID=UPI002981D67C|nr:CopG family ribbon-helix-helix protein [Rhizobium sp. PL01]MDW5317289.1 CopG family ribbon-helix-helix protein [Rhizobium sp. PL01]